MPIPMELTRIFLNDHILDCFCKPVVTKTGNMLDQVRLP